MLYVMRALVPITDPGREVPQSEHFTRPLQNYP